MQKAGQIYPCTHPQILCLCLIPRVFLSVQQGILVCHLPDSNLMCVVSLEASIADLGSNPGLAMMSLT